MSVISLSTGLNRANSPVDETHDSHIDSNVSALADARIRLGLSLEAIAQELNLSPDQIASLEQGDYRDFAGLVYLKGYLRNYARIVGVDPKVVLRGLEDATAEEEAAISMPAARRYSSPSRRSSRRAGRVIFPLMLLMLGLFVVGAGYLVFKKQWQAEDQVALLPTTVSTPQAGGATDTPAGVKLEIVTEKAPASSASTVSSSSTAKTYGIPIVDQAISARQPAAKPEPVTPSAPAASTSQPAANQPAPTPTLSVPSAPEVQPTASVIQPVQPSVTVQPPVTTTSVTRTINTTPAPGAGGLTLRGLDSSWVEIRDGDNIKLFSSTLERGQIVEFQSAPPFTIVLGAAAAVEVEHGGRAIDLPVFTIANVARFKIRADGGVETAPVQ